MSQQFTNIERLVLPKLIQAYGETDGQALWGGYTVARQRVIHEIAPYITRYEPNLTDHSEVHIKDVMENAFLLLGEESCNGNDSKTALNANELYFLVLAILFHDLGNIFGRKNHNQRLQEAYDFARGSVSSLLPEKRHLLNIVEAHCGQTRDGSHNTIGALDSEGAFRKERLDCQRVAAILRLADELAEGKQRTSIFVQKHFPLPTDNQVYHDYANVTEVCIDRGGARLVLTYNIEVCPEVWGGKFDHGKLKRLLKCCDRRSIKLDLERKYNTHYCSLLRPFKKTEISFYFHCRGRELRYGPRKIVLDDLVLPTPTDTMSLYNSEKAFDITKMVEWLKNAASKKQEVDL
jgi:hypothetical protein